MNDIEKQLNKEKNRLNSITAPDELETRLRNALQSAPPKKRERPSFLSKLATIALVFIIAAGSQYNALAFYGKKLLGFDELMGGTLKELNDKGLGQIIEKKTALDNGTDLTINGIITDSNQLIMYYTLSNPNGLDEDANDLFYPSNITGFLTDSNVESGTSLINEDKTEIKGTMSFEPVSPFSKKLTLHLGGRNSDDSISFPYKPNKAMGTELKQSIKKTVKVDNGKITFNTITASPTLTVIEGKLNVGNFDKVSSELDGIELVANGSLVQMVGSGHRSAFNGRKFNLRFDALPTNLDSLELVVKDFAGYKVTNKKIQLAGANHKPLKVGGKDLLVKNVASTSKEVKITIATDEDVMLDGVSIQTKSGVTPLKTTLNQTSSEVDGRPMNERTLLFDSGEKPEALLIEGLHYMERYNIIVEIPVD